MTRVFLIQEPPAGRDLSTAAKYGSFELIFSQSDKPSLLPGPCLFKARQKVRDAKPEDYFCWAGGDPYASFLVGIALAEQNWPSIKFLRWDRLRGDDGNRHGGFYVPTEVALRANRS